MAKSPPEQQKALVIIWKSCGGQIDLNYRLGASDRPRFAWTLLHVGHRPLLQGTDEEQKASNLAPCHSVAPVDI